jgi:hypothetical protein
VYIPRYGTDVLIGLPFCDMPRRLYTSEAQGIEAEIPQDAGGTMRTLYDGLSFEVIREGETYGDGSFTTRDAQGSMATVNRGKEGSRYRWGCVGMNAARTRTVGEYGEATERYRGIKVTCMGGEKR